MSQLHRHYKQGIEDEFDPSILKSFSFKKRLEGGNMHISKYNPAKYKFVMLLCYKQNYIKHALNQKTFIEPNIMNFASLY